MKIGSSRNVISSNRTIRDEDFVSVDVSKSWKLPDLLAQPYGEKDSFFRELVTNHLEGMYAAGKTGPITVTIPAANANHEFHSGDNNSVFITDTGVGLSEHDCRFLLFQITASSKDATDSVDGREVAGGMGVGSLSPLSVTTGFFFTTAKDGVLVRIQVFQTERGVARPVALRAYWDTKKAFVVGDDGENEVETDFESAGIGDWDGSNFSTTQVPVNPDTIADIREACERRIQFYTPEEVHVTNSDFGALQGARVTDTVRYGDVSLVPSGVGVEGGVYAIVAGVAYSLKGWTEDALRPFGTQSYSGYYSYGARREEYRINIHLSVKDVTIPTTRETLTQTPETKRVIRQKMEEAQKLFYEASKLSWETTVAPWLKNHNFGKMAKNLRVYREEYSWASEKFTIPEEWGFVQSKDFDLRNPLWIDASYSDSSKNKKIYFGSEATERARLSLSSSKLNVLVLTGDNPDVEYEEKHIFNQLARQQSPARRKFLAMLTGEDKQLYNKYKDFEWVITEEQLNELEFNFTQGGYGINHEAFFPLTEITLDGILNSEILEITRIDFSKADAERRAVNRAVAKLRTPKTPGEKKAQSQGNPYWSFTYNPKDNNSVGSSLTSEGMKVKQAEGFQIVVVNDPGEYDAMRNPDTYLRYCTYDSDTIEYATIQRGIKQPTIFVMTHRRKSEVLEKRLTKMSVPYKKFSSRHSNPDKVLFNFARKEAGWETSRGYVRDYDEGKIALLKKLCSEGLEGVAAHFYEDLRPFAPNPDATLAEFCEMQPEWVTKHYEKKIEVNGYVSDYVQEKTGIQIRVMKNKARKSLAEKPELIMSLLRKIQDGEFDWLLSE